LKESKTCQTTRLSYIKFDSNILEEAIFFSSYKYRRDLTKRIEVGIGTYLIVPSLYHQDVETDYILRIFLRDDLENKHINLLYLNEFEKDCKKKNVNTFDSKQVSFDHNIQTCSSELSSKTCSIL